MNSQGITKLIFIYFLTSYQEISISSLSPPNTSQSTNLNPNSNPINKAKRLSSLISKKYSKVSNELRQQLIDAIFSNNEKPIEAAQRLNINHSTAKSIISVYKKEGRINKKTHICLPSDTEGLQKIYLKDCGDLMPLLPKCSVLVDASTQTDHLTEVQEVVEIEKKGLETNLKKRPAQDFDHNLNNINQTEESEIQEASNSYKITSQNVWFEGHSQYSTQNQEIPLHHDFNSGLPEKLNFNNSNNPNEFPRNHQFEITYQIPRQEMFGPSQNNDNPGNPNPGHILMLPVQNNFGPMPANVQFIDPNNNQMSYDMPNMNQFQIQRQVSPQVWGPVVNQDFQNHSNAQSADGNQKVQCIVYMQPIYCAMPPDMQNINNPKQN